MQNFRQHPTNIVRLYFISFAVMVIIFVGGYVAINWLQEQNANFDSLINIAGRQRMLSQRITLLTLVDEDIPIEMLEELLEDWQTTQQTFLDEDDTSLSVRNINDENIYQKISDLSPLMEEIALSAQCIAQIISENNCPLSSDDLREQLFIQQNDFLFQMDTIVSDMQMLFSKRRIQYQRNSLILLLVELSGFLAIGLFLLRPSLRQINNLVTNLSQSQTMLKEQQIVLRKQGLLLEDAARLASVGAWELPIATMIPSWSTETRRIHEVDADYVPDLETAIDFYAPEARPTVEAAVAHSTETGEGWDFELPFITAKGNRKWVRSIGGVDIVDGELTRIYGVFQDLTERHELDEAIRRAEALQRTIISQLPNAAVIFFDTDMYIQLADGPFLADSGFSPDNMVGKKIPEVLSAEQMERLGSYCERVLAGEAIYYDRHEPETNRHYEARMYPLINDDEIQGGIVILRDTAAEYHAQRKLEESSKEFQRLAFNAPLGIFRATPNTDIIFINQYCADLLETSLEDLMAQGWIDRIHPDDVVAVNAERRRTLLNGIPFEMEYRVLSLENETIWVHSRSIPILGTDNKPVEYIGTLMDITIQKSTAEKLKEAAEAAEAANQAKSIFLANMSHELRTPLNSIIGFTQILRQDSSLKSEHREQVDIISHSGEHLLELINDVLEMSRIEANQTNLNKTALDLYKLLDNLHPIMNLRAEAKGINFLSEYTSDVPKYILTDAQKLRQVLINLISNAIKFTKQGGVALRVRHDQQQLYFEIEDSGVGIEPEAIPYLFEMFTQSASGKNSLEGTGLGLPISQRFIELMGGAITVDSRLDQGTLLSFNIPYEPVDMDDVEESDARRITGLQSAVKDYQILVVDDKPHSLQLLVQLLEPVGFGIRTATNGREAIDVVETWQPDLILMDIRMPEMDGFEATTYIRNANLPRQPIIIAVTASAFEHERQTILDNGCDDFVSKPYRIDVIFEAIRKHLGVEYRYDTSIKDSEKPRIMSGELKNLADLSKDIRSQLLEKTRTLDSEGFDILVSEIVLTHEALANELQLLADDFRFDVIRRKLEELE